MLNKTTLFLGITIYILLFLSFYPSFFTSLDENNFLRTAYLLKDGKISVEGKEYQIGFTYSDHLKAYVPYFIGQSILLIPFILLGWDWCFLLGMILHVIATYVFYKVIAKKYKQSIIYVLLYLFFPYLIFHSTTLYSDFSSAVLILCAFYLYLKNEKKDSILSGILFGFVCVIRYTNILVFIPFFIYNLIKNREKLIHLLIGFLPFIWFILIYNTMIFGSPFTTPYHTAGFIGIGRSTEAFSLYNYGTYLPFIIFRLLIIYPLMFFAPFCYKREGRWEILGAFVMFLMFYGARYQSGYGFGLEPSTLTRYFLPIIPLILITYPDFVESVIKKLRKAGKPLLVMFTIAVIIGSSFLLIWQSNYLSQQYDVHKRIYTQTGNNSLIIGEPDIARYILHDRRFLSMELYKEFPIDNSTFVVYKRNRILVRNLEYSTQTSYSGTLSRPFTLTIIKVGE